MRIAIMQPYSPPPYGGYFRLMSDVDVFVVYDCVQFPRRGWVHRNKLLDRNGRLQWLTLPLEHAPFDAKIKDLKFADDGVTRMREQMRRFPAIDLLPDDLRVALECAAGRFVPYAVRLLELCAKHLGVRMAYTYSSLMKVDPAARGAERIIEICKQLGATHYLNAPGGIELYNAATFAKHGIELEFLSPWSGPMCSVLETIAYKERKAA